MGWGVAEGAAALDRARVVAAEAARHRGRVRVRRRGLVAQNVAVDQADVTRDAIGGFVRLMRENGVAELHVGRYLMTAEATRLRDGPRNGERRLHLAGDVDPDLAQRVGLGGREVDEARWHVTLGARGRLVCGPLPTGVVRVHLVAVGAERTLGGDIGGYERSRDQRHQHRREGDENRTRTAASARGRGAYGHSSGAGRRLGIGNW